jgi:hypothetical protein
VALSGTAGTDPGDAGTVSLEVYSGTDTTGTPARTLSADVGAGGGWSTTTAPTLPDGTYTLLAKQSDTAGNTGRATTGFTVATVVPPVTVSSVTPSSLAQGVSGVSMTVKGANFPSDATVAFSGDGISSSVTSSTATTMSLSVSVTPTATVAARDVTVTNPDGGTSTCKKGFSITRGPTLTSIRPTTIRHGATVTMTLLGSRFDSSSGVVISGTGITVSSVTLVSGAKLTATVTVSPTAATGPRSVSVTGRNSAISTLTDALTLT